MEEVLPEQHGNYMEKFQRDTKKLIPGQVIRHEQIDHKFYFFCADTTLEVWVVDDKVFRIRYGNNGLFDADFSYALDPEYKARPLERLVLLEMEKDFVIETAHIRCVVSKENCGVRMLDLLDRVICEDEIGFHWEENRKKGGNIVICTKKIQSRENFFGLGDKPCDLNLRGKRLQMYGADTYGYGKDTDPIYKNIPFFMGLHHQIGYGIFLDNTFRTFFDFGKERQNVYSFWAHGGEMRYYFIYGPELTEVTETYTQLTGRPELPPLWALGYQQSKWSYYPDSKVMEIAQGFRSRRIPCDVIHIDIDYMDGFRCFTWDKERFPDPKKW